MSNKKSKIGGAKNASQSPSAEEIREKSAQDVCTNSTIESPGYLNGVAPKDLPKSTSHRRGIIIRLVDMFGDFLSLCISYILVFGVRFGFNWDLMLNPIFGNYTGPTNSHAFVYWQNFGRYVIFAFLFLGVFYAINSLYSSFFRLRKMPIMWTLIVVNWSLICVIVLYLCFFHHSNWHVRGFLSIVLLINPFVTKLMRMFIKRFFSLLQRKGHYLLPSVLVGAGKDAERLEKALKGKRLKGYRMCAHLGDFPSGAAMKKPLAKAIQDGKAQNIFMAQTEMPWRVFHETMRQATAANCSCIVRFPEFISLNNCFSAGDTLNRVPMVHFPALGPSLKSSKLRELGERALACVALVLLSPLFLIVSLLIRWDSKGPAFFKQDRYGLNNKRFKMYKFRTMVQDAEAQMEKLRKFNESDGALFKMQDDPRVTRIGSFLRKTSIDELPQLINIARGEMRFVGPRPLPCRDIEPYLKDWQGMRHLVPPGLTCIWQISGRSDVGFMSMSLLDLWYVYNRSFFLDVRILIRTAWVVLFSRGAY